MRLADLDWDFYYQSESQIDAAIEIRVARAFAHLWLPDLHKDFCIKLSSCDVRNHAEDEEQPQAV